MEHERLILTAKDGVPLFAQEWRNSSGEGSRGVICLVHGMGEHSSRYKAVAEVLTEADYTVLTYDQRGHGQSPGKRGHAPSVAVLTEDAKALLDLAADRYPALPRFLYGHSMGGNIAINCVLRLQPQIAGLILTSPWLRLAFQPPRAKQWIGRGLAHIWPAFSLSTGLNVSDLFRLDAGVPPGLPDPLVHERISVRMYFGLHEAGEWALLHAAAQQLRTPVLLAHGTADRVTSFAASEELAGKLGEGCTFVSWKDGLHELHNDMERADFLQAIVAWLEARLPA